MPVRARLQGGLLVPVRVIVCLLGLLVPLHLPFTLPEVGTVKMLGWSGRDLDGGRGLSVIRTTWYGRRSGVAPGDRVLAVNGRPATEAALHAALEGAPVGDSLALTLSRNGRVFEMKVPVVRSSVSYAGYSWYRLLLVVTSWVVGMVLVVWHGRSASAAALGTALLLVGPVMVNVAMPGSSELLRVANALCQYQAAAYRTLFPALLAHALVLQRPLRHHRHLRAWYLWVPVYAVVAVLLAISTDGLRDPVGWTLTGPGRTARALGGAAFELMAIGISSAVLLRRRGASGPARWLSQSVLLYVAVGVVVSVMSVDRALPAATVDAVRQIKSLGLLLLIVTSAVYCLSLADGEPSGSRLRGRLSTVASAGLTALFGFAVAGAGMVVHEQELSPLASEVLPYATVFVAAIAFSPVLRWAREMVERQMLARWADLEVRVNAFADQLAAELEPVRIAERVEAEVPALLGVARAELVLSRERVAGWRGGDGEEDVLPTEPLRTLHAELAADPPEPRLSAAVLGPGGALMGVLRVELRRHAAEPDPPQQAALAALVRGIGAALRIAEGYLRLRHAQRELSDAERVASLGAMAGGLAHEIKNPLLGLKLGLHLLRREGGNRERLERLAQDVGRIDDLVTGLLRFTHDEVHEEAGPVDVSELVRGCVRELRPLADDRSAVIREDYPDAGARVHATPMQLRLVVNNLVKNALDAVPDPGVVEVSVARRGGQVEVRVGDNGPGIPAPLRERLFDLAFSTKPGGSGIGLAVARRETERMGGTIQVDTASGDGTSMRVVLPHAPG